MLTRLAKRILLRKGYTLLRPEFADRHPALFLTGTTSTSTSGITVNLSKEGR